MKNYMVVGKYRNNNRFAEIVEAESGDDAENIVLKEYDPEGYNELEIAGTVFINDLGLMEIGS